MITRLLGVRVFDVEASSRCNLHCRFCPRDRIPHPGLMTDDTFERFLDWTPMGRADTIAFVGMGEPTLNPQLPNFVRRATERQPKAHTWVTSNGTTLNESLTLRLMDAGLDILDVSFNGLDAETYEHEMRGAKFGKSLANVERVAGLIRRRCSTMRLQINYVVSDGMKDDEATIQAFWRKRGIVDFRPQRLHNRAGLLATDKQQDDAKPGLNGRSCSIHSVTTFVDWRGDILHCCHDVRRRWPLGNVRDCSWRRLQAEKRRVRRCSAWPEMCAACTDPLRFVMRRQIEAKLMEAGRREACRMWERAGQKLFHTRPRTIALRNEV